MWLAGRTDGFFFPTIDFIVLGTHTRGEDATHHLARKKCGSPIERYVRIDRSLFSSLSLSLSSLLFSLLSSLSLLSLSLFLSLSHLIQSPYQFFIAEGLIQINLYFRVRVVEKERREIEKHKTQPPQFLLPLFSLSLRETSRVVFTLLPLFRAPWDPHQLPTFPPKAATSFATSNRSAN